MDSYEQRPSGGVSTWVIVAIAGVVLMCGCLALVGLGAVGYYAYMRTQMIVEPPLPSDFTTPIAIATEAPIPTPADLEVEEVPTEAATHEDEGSNIIYNSDPPTSGHHYPVWADAGIYDEPIADGYLVHNLEHGYVIIWFDCDHTDDCDALKDDIQAVIDTQSLLDTDQGYKIIGMPRSGMETLIALTSWGRLARLDTFDRDKILEFISLYQGVAPEPNAP